MYTDNEYEREASYIGVFGWRRSCSAKVKIEKALKQRRSNFPSDRPPVIHHGSKDIDLFQGFHCIVR